MAHAVANEWRSQKEVILLSQVLKPFLFLVENEFVSVLTFSFGTDAHEWPGEHMSRQSATTGQAQAGEAQTPK